MDLGDVFLICWIREAEKSVPTRETWQHISGSGGGGEMNERRENGVMARKAGAISKFLVRDVMSRPWRRPVSVILFFRHV